MASFLPGDLTSCASPHAQRLLQLNIAAEKVLFLNKLLIAVGEQLEKLREALGAYRRGEAGRALPSSSSSSSSSCSSSSSSRMAETCALTEDWYLFGETFVAVDSEQICSFLFQRRERLQQRRSRLLQQRRGALRALLALSPSAAEIESSDWGFLLRDSEAKQQAAASSDSE
ncbi:hypothetical protein ENH_00016720 [Eimeria necatrix]|uniref:Uncharacterized protein n=1 Tax=Eimeria necatrix TaxID=51315 RepID=U6MHE9_9EIME|nr:hypothetical protein ENH_00016720 [Eimeria necatrix]CDJ62498.1 hypothetical protein ENH_00016720 [Eimeria necatrix]